MTFDYGRTAATAALALAACMALAACDDGSGSAASAASPSAPPPTAAPSASESATPSTSPTPVDSRTVTASADPTTVASTSPTPTATAKTGTARPTAAPSTTAAVPAACENRAVSADVKSAVTRTWEYAKGVSHIQPKPGGFYYGGCGTTLYAAARFEAGPGATGDDMVQLQDEGSGLQFFRFTPGSGWSFVGSDTYPATGDCSRFAPVALAHRWDCS